MCGRFTSLFSLEDISVVYGTEVFGSMSAPRYNICPTQDIFAVRQDQVGRVASSLRWGLVPHWAKDLSIGAKMTNARCETVAEKHAFRSAIKARRCIIPASGWYEWAAVAGKKVPHYFTRRDGGPCSFAGIWEVWTASEGGVIETCSILTTDANDLVRSVHDRMPVILAPDDFTLWFDPLMKDPARLQHLYRPFDPSHLQEWEVAPLVNSVRNNSEECIRALLPQGSLF